MSLIAWDGFEDYTDDRTLANATHSTAQAYSGDWSAKCFSTGATSSYVYLMQANSDTSLSSGPFNCDKAYFTFRFRYATKVTSGAETLCGFVNKMELRLKSDGKLAFYRKSGFSWILVATGATVLAANTWYRIDIYMDSETSSAYEIKVDGDVELSGSANFGGLDTDKVFIGCTTRRGGLANFEYYFDDLVLDDARFYNDPRISRLDADGAGSDLGWAGLWMRIDDQRLGAAYHDGDTSAISTNRLASESIALETLTSAGDIADTNVSIIALRNSLYARNNSAATSHQLNLYFRYNSTYDHSGSYVPSGSTYNCRWHDAKTQPGTSNKWTVANLENQEHEVGIRMNFLDGGYAYCTVIFCMVLWDLPDDTAALKYVPHAGI